MFLRRAVGTYHLLRRRERFLSSFIPRVVKIIQIQKKQEGVYCLSINALLVSKRCPFEVLLTPFKTLTNALLKPPL